MKPRVISLSFLVVIGCSESPPAESPDASPTTIDASACADRVSATIGAAGGVLAHCAGAQITIPPGALAADVELSITRVIVADEPVAPYVRAGETFAFAGPTGLALTAYAEVLVPHDGAGPVERRELAALTADGWVPIESCTPTATHHVWHTAGRLDTFVAVRDPTPYPADGPTALGEGTIDYTFGTVTDTLAIDPWGLAIDNDLTAEGRTLQLVFRRQSDTGLVQIQLGLMIDAVGVATPFEASRADTNLMESWSTDEFSHPGEIELAITSDVDGVITGTVHAVLHGLDTTETRVLDATFTARSGHWRYPPERVCALTD